MYKSMCIFPDTYAHTYKHTHIPRQECYRKIFRVGRHSGDPFGYVLVDLFGALIVWAVPCLDPLQLHVAAHFLP